jgi:hypothetical protein
LSLTAQLGSAKIALALLLRVIFFSKITRAGYIYPLPNQLKVQYSRLTTTLLEPKLGSCGLEMVRFFGPT